MLPHLLLENNAVNVHEAHELSLCHLPPLVDVALAVFHNGLGFEDAVDDQNVTGDHDVDEALLEFAFDGLGDPC